MQGFKKNQVEKFTKLLTLHHFKAGETIVKEGSVYDTIKFLFQGSAEVVNSHGLDQKEYHVDTLNSGAFFGEMGFISSKAASATIRAKENCSVFSLPRSKVRNTSLYNRLIENIALLQVKRLKSANEKYINSMQQTIEKQKEQNQFGRFYITTILLFAIASFIPNTTTSSPMVQIWASWFFLMFILIPIAYLVRKQKTPLASFGVTGKGWFRAAYEGLLVAIVFAPVVMLAKIMTSPVEEKFFTWKSMSDYSNAEMYFYLITYIPHSAIQEFMARGVIQGSLHKFMVDSHFMIPIFITSALFGVAHLHISAQFAVLTFCISLIFGYVYYMHQSIVGVSVLHWALGMLALSLGFL